MKEHVIINRDRTVVVPESLKKIGIQFDHNVNTITFDCPRYPDEDSSIDMSQMPIFINYMLPDKTPGSSLALSVVVDETDNTLMHFDWKITNAITPVNGVLSTLICVKQSDTEGNELYHWNTDLFQKFTVGNGMECNGQVAEMNPDVISQLLARMGEVDTRTSAEAMSGYINEYMTKNPPQPTDEQASAGINTYMASNGQTHVDAYMTENQELVQNSVDDYLGRNPLQLDDSLIDSTKAAPADKVGELKSDLSHLDNTVFDKKKSEYVVTTTPRISYQFKKGMKYSIHISASGTTQLQVGTIDTSSNYIDSTSVITGDNVDTDFEFIASNDSNTLYVYKIPSSTPVSITINDFSDYRFATKDEIKEPIKNDYSKIIQNSFKVESDIWGIVNGTVSDNGLVLTSGGSAFHRMPVAFDDFVMSATFKITSEDAVVGLAMEGWKSKITLEASNNRVVIYNNPTNTTDLSVAETVMLSETIRLNKWYKLVLKRDGWDYNITVIDLANMFEILNHSYSNFEDTNTRNYCRFTGYFGIVCDSGTSLCGDFYVSINHKKCKCLIIGDSLTEGDQVTNSDRWAYRLKNEYFKGNAIVAGCGGDSTNAIKNRLEKYIALGIDFDICIVLGGMNNRDGSNQDTFKSNMSDIVDLILSKNAIPIIAVNPIPSSGADDIHTQRAYVVSKGWNTIRFDYAFSPSYTHNTALFNSDGIHPNENGNAVMYETVRNLLDKLLIN